MKPKPNMVVEQIDFNTKILSINKKTEKIASDEEGPILPEGNKKRIHGALVGRVKGFDAVGRPLVDFSDNPSGHRLPAQTTIKLNGDETGQNIVLLFENSDPYRPIIMGLLRQNQLHAEGKNSTANQADLEIDSERIVFTADREIVLRCGKGSITLTKAGKVIVRGAYIVSRSTGVNRIKGGSVQIN